MDRIWLYLPLALASALAFALAAVLEKREAMRQPASESLKLSLFRDLAQRPVWLLAIVFETLGFGLKIFAVDNGPVMVIQPILATQVVFALIFGVLIERYPTRIQDWVGALMVAGGVAIFIEGTGARSGHYENSAALWTIVLAVTVGITVVTLAAGRFIERVRPFFWGCAAGCLWGLQIAFIKVVTTRFHREVDLSGALEQMFLEPYVYGLLVTAVTGFLVLQSAFQSGSLAIALTSYTAVEIVTAVALGALFFGEVPNMAVQAIVLIVVAIGLMTGGILVISRSPAVRGNTSG